jgi:hypothetical protein
MMRTHVISFGEDLGYEEVVTKAVFFFKPSWLFSSLRGLNGN